MTSLVIASVALVAASQAERVPEAAIVNGMPQGLFVGRSTLTGRAVCLLFLSSGRVTRAIPTGGLERFDWASHQAAHPGDVGEWTMAGGGLRIAWGDGGVHQGPLTLRPDGIEFYGKRYRKPARVQIADIAGQWESARGSPVAGGEGVMRSSSLVIEEDGRYRWVATTGGRVAGRTAAAEQVMTGRIAIATATLLFRSDAGLSTEYTFLPVAGAPVSAFSLDTEMFTRIR